MNPSGGSETSFEAFLGSAQFQLRTLEAVLQVLHGGLWVEADCSTQALSELPIALWVRLP
eukprot:9137886-Alexandrium_andersonii.AAC.1